MWENWEEKIFLWIVKNGLKYLFGKNKLTKNGLEYNFRKWKKIGQKYFLIITKNGQTRWKKIEKYFSSDATRSDQASRLRNTEVESTAWSTPSHFRHGRHSRNREVTNESLTEKRITFGSNVNAGHFETSFGFKNQLLKSKVENRIW